MIYIPYTRFVNTKDSAAIKKRSPITTCTAFQCIYHADSFITNDPIIDMIMTCNYLSDKSG